MIFNKKRLRQNWGGFSVQIKVISKKKKKVFTKMETVFLPNLGDLKKKGLQVRWDPVFWSISLQVLDQVSPQIPLEGLFS